MKNDYYIYLHSKNNVVFYIGKGRGDRAYRLQGRSIAWKKLVKEESFEVSFLHKDLSNSEAERIETSYLTKPNPEWQLVNIKTKTQTLDLSETHKHVYYAEDSLTFLRWSSETVPSKRKKDGIAGSYRKNGYSCVVIDGVSYMSHRIIWELFNGKIPSGMVINHIDCNPRNNNINNLELVTYAENNRRKTCHGIKPVITNTSGINRVRESKTSPNKSGIIYYNVTVTWYKNDKSSSKSFSYLKYGKEKAWELAIAFNATLLSNKE